MLEIAKRALAGSILIVLLGIAPAQAQFAITDFDGQVLDAAGNGFSQAGGHPYAAGTTFQLKAGSDGLPDGGGVKDVQVDLPAGFVGNLTAVKPCPQGQKVPSGLETVAGLDANGFCRADSIVGLATIGLTIGTYASPVFSVEPAPGVVATLAFNYLDTPVFLDASIRTDGDYGVTIRGRWLNQSAAVLGTSLTLWGTPADHSHDAQRCLAIIPPIDFFPAADCAGNGDPGNPLLSASVAGSVPKAFLTNPTSCTAPGVGVLTRISLDSWTGGSDSSTFESHNPPASTPLAPLALDQRGPTTGPTGCASLPFDPSVQAQLTTAAPDAPTGLEIGLAFPQQDITNPSGLVTAHLKTATVTLPEGMTISPSAADGLVGCPDAQWAVGTLAAAQCPDASKIGTVQATTPLLSDPLQGALYVGSQHSDDPASGDMFRLLLTVDSEERGIHVKLPGQVRVNPATGRVQATFDNNPQLPIGTLKLRLKGGPRAPLATPADCGAKTIHTELTSWSGKTVERDSPVAIACPGAQPLAPSYTAGTTSNAAGKHTSFVLRVERPDGQQTLSGLSLSLPPGLLATLNGVPRCADVEASAGACPDGSRVGTATVGAGPGSNPFFLRGGVYLTGPYKGAPFGLAVAIRVLAGPFDLGTVVVRQQLLVDQHDAHVSVVSDPLPTILKGVPIRLRSLNVDVDRPAFILNPTGCAQQSVGAVFGAADGSLHAASSPFAASNCAALPFSPTFSAATTAKTSRANGASFDAKILIGVEGESNAHVVAVSLPRQLPSRLTTIQKACLDSVFNVNPAGCPAASLVGSAAAVTPVLSSPLTGPAYLVSHGGAGFPDLVIVLQGEGVRFDLVGAINISSKGITSTRFANAPDVPINSFELKLPQGPHSILTGNGSLCVKPLLMPTTITAFNGKQVKQSTRIKVSGCPRAKKAKKHPRTPRRRVR
ncbi:MAG TPA: hypothetical protein VLJ42_00400 [Solirubrobacteraceae bacterium]|nr:hypothetical protein [Solirubrobacteraceae bacterium]